VHEVQSLSGQPQVWEGMIYGPAHGDMAFAVPPFDEFMLRAMPTWNRMLESTR